MSKLPTIVKSHSDPRHLRRIKNMQSLFAYDSGNSLPSTPDAINIIAKITDIDSAIRLKAPKWPLDKINKVDLAILRCAVWELLWQKTAPPKVSIDEAVELGKEFGTETSSSFINGCLGSIINQEYE
jgi:transcription termination factor NusB